MKITMIAAALLTLVASTAEAKLRHGYVDNRYGQLHYVIAQPAGPSTKRPVVLFHQSPNSSAELEGLVEALGRDRVVIGVDTPGHGGSDGPEKDSSIEAYAGAIAEGLEKLGYGAARPIDVFGYHTGSKIATELAATRPDLVRRVVLSGIYDPPPAQLQEAINRTQNPATAREMFDKFCAALPATDARYVKMGLSDPQWAHIRIDSMRAMTRQELGHKAAFAYAPKFKARSALVKQPVLLIPLDDGLAAETIAAKANFSNAAVTPKTFSAGAMFTESDGLADAFRAFLDKTS